jgi:methylated-DNA-[protein]-cysteine S-methyltransferase
VTLHAVFPTRLGDCAIVWDERPRGALVRRIFLSCGRASARARLAAEFPGAGPGRDEAVDALAERLRRFVSGDDVAFELSEVDLGRLPAFQQAVLVAEHGIPRGRVSSYGSIARHIGMDRSARAVGRALASNPFPIVVPCHRAVRSDGDLGGYQGGVAMKRALLELEGARFSRRGKLVGARFYYR